MSNGLGVNLIPALDLGANFQSAQQGGIPLNETHFETAPNPISLFGKAPFKAIVVYPVAQLVGNVGGKETKIPVHGIVAVNAAQFKVLEEQGYKDLQTSIDARPIAEMKNELALKDNRRLTSTTGWTRVESVSPLLNPNKALHHSAPSTPSAG